MKVPKQCTITSNAYDQLGVRSKLLWNGKTTLLQFSPQQFSDILRIGIIISKYIYYPVIHYNMPSNSSKSASKVSIAFSMGSALLISTPASFKRGMGSSDSPDFRNRI